MTEGLFLITTLFVAYVVYVIINEKKTGTPANTSAPAAKKPENTTELPQQSKAASTAPLKAEPVTAAAVKPATVKAAPKPATPKAAAKPAAPKAPAKPVAAKASEPPKEAGASEKSKGLKDPKSGEVVTSYTNYRFVKRWIKEALVAEGLVEKVYKNDELTAELETQIRTAIGKLEGIKKYQP